MALFEKFLNNGRPEQIAAYRDDNPILMEVLKVFNKTIQTQVLGYTAHKAMLVSNDTECDRNAIEKADKIMQQAFDNTTECLITFRQRVRTEVNPSIINIREVKNKTKKMEKCVFSTISNYFIDFSLRLMTNFVHHYFCPLTNVLIK